MDRDALPIPGPLGWCLACALSRQDPFGPPPPGRPQWVSATVREHGISLCFTCARRADFREALERLAASAPLVTEGVGALVTQVALYAPPPPPDGAVPVAVDGRDEVADPSRLRERIRALARCDDELYRRYVEVIVGLKRQPERLRDRTISAGVVQAVLEDPERPQLLGDLAPFRSRLYRRFRTISGRLHRRGDPRSVTFTDAVEDGEAVVQAEVASG